MTLFDHVTFQSVPLANLHFWRCKDECGFHLRAGSVVLTFTPEELAAFLRAAAACYLGAGRAHLEATSDAVRPEQHQAHLTHGEPEIQQFVSAAEH